MQIILSTRLRKMAYLSRRVKEKALDTLDDGIRSWQYRLFSDKSIINDKEFRILGLRRSGNHAIVNWMQKQLSDNHIFMNHVRVAENPYRDVYRDQCFLRSKPDLKGIRYENLNWWHNQSRGKFSPKDYLIYSYEDQEIGRVANPYFEMMHDFYVGKSIERYDVLIIRDPFNLFASRMKGNKPRENARTFDFMKVYSRRLNLPEMWVTYAKECLGETNYLKNKKIAINYNLWFSSLEYRKSISGQLGLDFSDEGFNEVVRAGGIGSSFDQTAFAGRADKMDVLGRWKILADNPDYRQLFNNKELLDYSEKLFGHIPGTDTLFD